MHLVVYLFIYFHINSVEKLEENGHLEEQRMRGVDNMKIRKWTGYIWLRIWVNFGLIGTTVMGVWWGVS
jgi:competence protein ComGF